MYMKVHVRHEQARQVFVITYMYGTAATLIWLERLARASEDATPLTTDVLRRADHAMNYRESVRQTAKTAAYWAPGIDTMVTET